MEKKEIRKVEFFYKDYHVGTLFDKDENGLYTYNSNAKGEDKVIKNYFFPMDYEKEMLNSVNRKSNNFAFVSSVCSKLTRADLRRMLKITPSDSDFDMLYKLAQQSEFVGENFKFETGEAKEGEGKCQTLM